MLLAATLLLRAVPFMLVAAALAGRSVVSELSWRLGLSKTGRSRSRAPAHLFLGHLRRGRRPVLGLFILAGIAAATAIQRLYKRVFGLDPRGARDRVVLILSAAMGLMGKTAACPGPPPSGNCGAHHDRPADTVPPGQAKGRPSSGRITRTLAWKSDRS
jgi:membrane protein